MKIGDIFASPETVYCYLLDIKVLELPDECPECGSVGRMAEVRKFLFVVLEKLVEMQFLSSKVLCLKA